MHAIKAPIFFVTSLVCSLLVASCGDDSSGGSSGSSVTGASGKTNAQRYCEGYCGWKERCGKPKVSCVEGCLAQGTLQSVANNWRDSYADKMPRCFETLACDKIDDNCLADFSLADPAFPDIPVVQNCLKRRDECGQSFPDDICQSLAAYNDSTRTEAEACRAKPCDQVAMCLVALGAFSF